MHFTPKHISAPQTSKSAAVKPEKAKRPEMSADMSDEDWGYFVHRWEAYKKATGLEGEEIVLQKMDVSVNGLLQNWNWLFFNAEKVRM